MSEEKEDCIAVRHPGCKRLVFVAINEPHVMNTQVFKDISEMIKDGCTVEHMTLTQFRKEPFGCKCDE